ncbi:glutathione S-transferase C-terminal domain-containing protein [Bifidobacterium thermophilum]|uniref:glutathione S-transferase C-terminal domain-containing protein n=1 Tax=Bifidobacterium thermophilum TaxID=33905 RepID=UPI0030AA4D28
MAFDFSSNGQSLSVVAADACGVAAHRERVSRPGHDEQDRPVEETTVEQTPDGAFRRQRNAFTVRFGSGPGQAPVQAGRYHILGALGCGWNRRQRIVIRLLGLWDAFTPEIVYGRDENGWKLTHTPGGVADLFGYERLNDFYRATTDHFTGRGTSPTVVDLSTGKVVTNNYHILSNDLETAWAPFHKEGAPDLYPQELRQEIDLLNQQIFDDVNNGTYKVNFATSQGAATAAYTIFKARLADYDFRLASRRYLFGGRITDSDVRLFQTLESFESTYRPGFVRTFGTDEIIHIWDYPNLFAYGRDLFQTPGFIDDEELYALGFTPDENGNYRAATWEENDGPTPQTVKDEHKALYERWLEPADRTHLGGSPLYSGPGGGGSFELWQFGAYDGFYRD